MNIIKIFKNRKPAKSPDNIQFRYQPVRDDCGKVREILIKTGFFSDEELKTAVELIEEKLEQGDLSTYRFVFAEHGEKLLGYTCYGLIPLTRSSYDLYWIAVDPDSQGTGLGKILLSHTEDLVKESGGSQIYSETSSRKQYLPTRKFYMSCGYRKRAYFPDFYYPGDGKIIFYKKLN